MYIDPFVAGIFAIITLDMIIIFLYTFSNRKK